MGEPTTDSSAGPKANVGVGLVAGLTVERLLDDLWDGHSDFQLRRFVVLEPGLTPYGIYMQCLTELESRYHGRFTAAETVKEQQAKIDRLNEQGRNGDDCDAQQQRRCLAALLRQQADDQREYDCLLGIARELKAELGELTPERRAVLDEDMWFHKAQAMAAIDRFLFLHPGVNRDTVELIIAYPPEMRQRLLAEVAALEKPGMADRWVETAEMPRLATADCPARIERTAGPSVT